ncbi:MAG TPA: Pvc16 family protein [Actinophytocola sp.]|nr:Pvc16 family protein [Actinophytocola sp.]
MITDVDEALRVLLGRSLPPGTVVRLDPPRPTWETETAPGAVDLFLYGLRDDRGARESGWDETRDGRGAVVARRDAVRRCALSYLVTARAADVAEEHRLLDVALRTMVFADQLPADCLPGELAGQPVFVLVADTEPGTLWSNLGMPARAAFAITVSAPFVPEPDTDLAPAAEKIRLDAGQTVPRGPLAPARAKRWVRTP